MNIPEIIIVTVLQAIIGKFHLDSTIVFHIDKIFRNVAMIINIFQIHPKRVPGSVITRSQLSSQKVITNEVHSNFRYLIIFKTKSGCGKAFSVSFSLREGKSTKFPFLYI